MSRTAASAATPAPDPGASHAHPRARAAAGLRRLGHALMGHEADEAVLERVALEADRLAAELEAAPARVRDPLALKRRMFDHDVPDGATVIHFDECFVSGPFNPMGIAIDVHREGDEVVAQVELGAAFEGAPGRSHGGIVAAIFDDVFGYLLTLERTPGFTGELTVRYLAATPIAVPLEFRARLVAREGRRLLTRGEARAGGSVVATGEATFVAITADRLRP